MIKHFSNWLLKHLNCECLRIRKPKIGRRNAITPGRLQRKGKGASVTVDVEYDSDSEGRRNSGEMFSMRDFLKANKISLAMMQKQPAETSQRTPGGVGSSGNAFQQRVGPLAILNKSWAKTKYKNSVSDIGPKSNYYRSYELCGLSNAGFKRVDIQFTIGSAVTNGFDFVNT